jgi:hypothetical protein
VTDLTGTTRDGIEKGEKMFTGYHTVNRSGELLDIGIGYDIHKQSIDNGAVVTLIERPPSWYPCCLYCSSVTGDLLVAMNNYKAETSQVTRYLSDGKHQQSFQLDNMGQPLYRDPRYITENKNGDIVVSDLFLGAVVVTDSGGRHRFSYTGPERDLH